MNKVCFENIIKETANLERTFWKKLYWT